MNKTIKNFVEMLEFLRKEESSYRELLNKFAHFEWDTCLISEEKLLNHSRVQFMGLFSHGWFRKPVEVTIFINAAPDGFWHCFLKIDDQLYKVAPRINDATTMEKE